MMIIMTRMCQGDGSANKRIKPGERFCEVAANLMREEEEEGWSSSAAAAEGAWIGSFFEILWSELVMQIAVIAVVTKNMKKKKKKV